MRLAATRRRPTGVEVCVIDDAGAGYTLWKHGHPHEQPVDESWWRPIVEAMIAQRNEEAARDVALKAEFESRIGIQSDRHQFIDAVAAALLQGNHRMDAALRALARAAREDGVF